MTPGDDAWKTESVYGRLNQDLPAITKSIIRFSGMLNQYFSVFLLTISGIILLAFWQRKQIWFRKLSSHLLIRIPIFGKLVHQLYLSRFCQAMAFLLDAKVPLLHAIELCKRMILF